MTCLLLSILSFLFFGIGFSLECTARYEINTQPPHWPNGLNAQLSVDVKNTSILTDGWAINFTAKGFGSKSPLSISSFWNVGSITRVDNGDNTVTYSLINAHYNAHNPQFIGFNAKTVLPHPRNIICGLSINNNPCSIISSPLFPPPTSSSILLSYDYHNGDPTLPLIVLIHGITDNRHSWDPLIPLLTPHYRILNVDLRGHGQSTITPNRSDYEPQALAADVYHTILQVVGSGDLPLMVGHSLGGLVVSVYAHEYPVRGVVCVDQSMDLRDLQVTVKAAEPLLMGNEAMFKLLFANINYGALNASEAARLDALRNPIQSVVIGVWGLMLDLTTEQLSAKVDEFMQVPGGTSYLALFGTNIGPAYEGWLKERIPAAEYELWGPAGHYIHLIYPHLFVQRVRDFDSIASLKTCL